MSESERQKTIARTFAALREYTDPRGHFLLDTLEDLVNTERQVATLTTALLRAAAAPRSVMYENARRPW